MSTTPEGRAVRLSKNVFTRLAFSMIGFGLLIGLVFPFAIQAFPHLAGLTPAFFGFTIAAGLLVGGFNIFLARMIVRPKLRLMADRMSVVEESISEATYTGDWSRCDPETCSVPVLSDDEFGQAAAAFNQLIVALAESHKVEGRLSEFTHAMSAELDIERLCQAAIDRFRSDLGATAVTIIGYSQGELDVIASHGMVDPDRLIEADLVQRSLRTLESDSMALPAHLAIDAGIAHVVPANVYVYPLKVQSAAIGAVVLGTSVGLPKGSVALSPVFMQTFAVALANALAHQNIQRLAALDPLTGLYNRRFGLGRLHEEYARSIRSGQPLGLVMFDIDHFKKVNDTYGHLVGDAVLKSVATEARTVLREGDVFVRYGGEEFLAILPGAGYKDCRSVAERIRRLVAEHVVRAGAQEIHVTVSAGFGSSPDLAIEGEMDLVEAADMALYEAKQAGRDRIQAATSAA